MDLRTFFDTEARAADLVMEGGALSIDDGLETAVVLSLFTDRRAETDDLPPGGARDRRGWFGDGYADVDGDRIGSRLWLLAREKQTAEVLQRAREYAREALAWLIEDRIAHKVDLTTRWLGQGVIGIEVAITRIEGATLNLRFEQFWSQSNAV